MQHLEEGTIHAWIDGALDAEEAARVEQHVAECATCASAVAEARGLVAGASRILAALDDVPSGVVPRSGGGGAGALGGGSTIPRRPRSVWTYLHMTPARAAAAAFLIVAAGTALVMRQASEATHRGVYSAAAQPGATAAKPPVPATPLPAPALPAASPAAAAPKVVDSMAAPARGEARTENGAGLRGAAIAGPVKAALPAPSPPPLAVTARNDVAQKRSMELTQVASSADSAAVRDSISMTRLAASSRGRLDSARRARAQLSDVAVTAVGGAAPTAAPSAARAFAAVRRQTNYAGCYSVVGDSLSVLPKRLSLDSARFDKALADQFAAAPRFSVSALTDIGRRPIDSASWQPRPDGVLISFGRTPLNLRVASDSSLSMAGVAGGGSMMTLRRVDCPPAR